MQDEQEKKETQDLLITPSEKEKREAEDIDVGEDLAVDEPFKTQHSDGHTHNPHHAQDQGLTYTPPTDPPVQRGDDPQGAEVAAGFDLSAEEGTPMAERIPERIASGDLNLRDKIYETLQNNSETGHLDQIKVQVDNGVANLIGTVPTQGDIGLVHNIVGTVAGVAGIQNNLQTEELK